MDSTDPKLPGLGVARFIRIKDEPAVAEFALTVIDACQQRGLGTILLALLYLLAETRDLQMLRAVVVGENEAMFKWLCSLGATESFVRGEYQLNLPVHRDPSRLARTPSAEQFQHALRVVQRAAIR